jgi:hypothetical protein
VSRAAEFRRQRQRLQDEQVARLADMLPLPQIRLPFLFSTELGPQDLAELADAFEPQLGMLEERP